MRVQTIEEGQEKVRADINHINGRIVESHGRMTVVEGQLMELNLRITTNESINNDKLQRIEGRITEESVNEARLKIIEENNQKIEEKVAEIVEAVIRRKGSSINTSLGNNNNQGNTDVNSNQGDNEIQVVEQTSDPGPSSSSGGSRSNVIVVSSDVPNEQPRVQGKQSFVLTDITVPRFGNSAGQNPLRFIKDLETFFELRGVPRYAKLSVVKHSLYANCIGWFEMHVSDDTSYEEFKDLFLGHYWDQSRQSEIR